jgi:hypothetical protein
MRENMLKMISMAKKAAAKFSPVVPSMVIAFWTLGFLSSIASAGSLLRDQAHLFSSEYLPEIQALQLKILQKCGRSVFIETLFRIPIKETTREMGSEASNEKMRKWIGRHLSHSPANGVHILIALEPKVVFVVFGSLVRKDPRTPSSLRDQLVNLLATGLGRREDFDSVVIEALQTFMKTFEPGSWEEEPKIVAVENRVLDPKGLLLVIAPGLGLAILLRAWCQRKGEVVG